jgi:hypothetical protein
VGAHAGPRMAAGARAYLWLELRRYTPIIYSLGEPAGYWRLTASHRSIVGVTFCSMLGSLVADVLKYRLMAVLTFIHEISPLSVPLESLVVEHFKLYCTT